MDSNHMEKTIISILRDKVPINNHNAHSYNYYYSRSRSEPKPTHTEPDLIDIAHLLNTFIMCRSKELQQTIVNLSSDILWEIYTKIENYVVKYTDVSDKPGDTAINNFVLFMYQAIQSKIRSGDIFVLLLVILYYAIGPAERQHFSKDDFKYAQECSLSPNWKGKTKMASIFPRSSNLIFEDNFETRFVYNNDIIFSIWNIVNLKRNAKRSSNKGWFTSDDIFRYFWSFMQYEQLTRNEFISTINSNIINDYFSRPRRYHSSAPQLQLKLFFDRINYFLLKYPKSIDLILANMTKYFISMTTLLSLYFNQYLKIDAKKLGPSFQPSGYLNIPQTLGEITIMLNDQTHRLLTRKFLRTNLETLLHSVDPFKKCCQDAMVDRKLGVKHHVKRNYINNNDFWETSVLNNYFNLYKLHISNKTADDGGLMILLRHTICGVLTMRIKDRDYDCWPQVTNLIKKKQIVPIRVKHVAIFCMAIRSSIVKVERRIVHNTNTLLNKRYKLQLL